MGNGSIGRFRGFSCNGAIRDRAICRATPSGDAVQTPRADTRSAHPSCGASACTPPLAHQGNPALADSQIYVTLEAHPDLDNRYTVFGHLTAGDEVPARLERGDLVRKMYVKE